MKEIRKTYKRDRNHNYLLLSLEEPKEQALYQIQMIRENKIEGLLTCEAVLVDGKYEYKYEITSRQQMDRVYEKRGPGGEEIRHFLQGLQKAMEGVEKYLLDLDSLLVVPEYIYMDIEEKIPVFCYLPGYGQDFREEFREFTKYLLRNLDHNDIWAVSMGYEMYRLTLDENYDMDAVLGLIYQREETDGISRREQSGCSPAAEKEHIENEEIEEDGTIENGTEEAEPERKEKPYEKKRRDFRKQKKNKNKNIRQNKNTRDQKKTETYQNRPAAKGDVNRAETNKKQVWKKAVILLAGITFGGSILAAAAILGKLNLTQLGGLIFLFLGLIIYFTSVWEGPGQKKKGKDFREREADEFQEEYRELLRERTAKTKKNTDSEKLDFQRQNKTSDEEDMQEEALFWDIEEIEEKAVSQKMEKQKKEKAKAADTEDIMGAGRKTEETKRKQVHNEDEYYGETTFLGGEEEEDVRYYLISYREEREIYLEKEDILVGKLESQADIILSDPSVSRIHARLTRGEEGYYILDLNSTNGTYLNGRRLSQDEQCLLKDKDIVRFAACSYTVEKR